MSSFHIGARVRTTKVVGGSPAGIHGGIVGQLQSNPSQWFVDMDDGQSLLIDESSMEVFTPVFANHYHPVIASANDDDSGVTDDDHDYTPAPKDTSLSGDELMNITRSFCR